MKPDWKDAPSWARYLAMDKNGDWFWHEYEPSISDNYWTSDGYMRFAVPDNSHWKTACEERPS